MSVEEFIARTNKLSSAELYELRMVRQVEIQRIKLQLSKPTNRCNVDWKMKAESALAFKIVELDYINGRIDDLNNTCRRFMDTAYHILDRDTYNVIYEEATA